MLLTLHCIQRHKVFFFIFSRVIGIQHSSMIFKQEGRSIRLGKLLYHFRFVKQVTPCLPSFFSNLISHSTGFESCSQFRIHPERKKLKKSHKRDDNKKRYLFLCSFSTDFTKEWGCAPCDLHGGITLS